MPTDDIFDALADVARRRVLVTLLAEDPLRVSAMTGRTRELTGADEGLLREHLASAREVSDADEELLRLHHVHLPKLAEYGFVEWDAGARRISKGPRFHEVSGIVDRLDDTHEAFPLAGLGEAPLSGQRE